VSGALRRRVPWAPPSSWQRGASPPTVVAVPGLGLSVDGWRGPGLVLASRPRGGFAVVALPAHGLPARHGEPLDPAASAQRLLARLDELGAARVALLGHSASCQVVTEAARREPERVTALVLVGPTTDPRAPTWPRLAARWLATAAHERLGQVPLLVRDYGHSGLVTFARAMDAARRHPLAPALAGLDHPVLLVRGPYDRIAPQVWLDDLVALRPGIEAVTLLAGGHMVPVTHPHELAAAVGPFLARHAGPRS
jgi:pimeloyl-ACP methyl ester carboxylesterase